MSSRKKPRTRVLFICLGNSCRSQMAEAIARHHASDVIEPSSAGLIALGFIAQGTIDVLHERGVEIGRQFSKPLKPELLDSADLVVNLSSRPLERVFAGKTYPAEDWDVDDPYGDDAGAYRHTCDEVEKRVRDLAQRLRESHTLRHTARPAKH